MGLWNASLFSEASGTALFRAILGKGSGQVVGILGCTAAAVPVSSGVAVPFHSDRRIRCWAAYGPATPTTPTTEITVLPNKEMKLTKPGQDGASQLISSVRRT